MLACLTTGHLSDDKDIEMHILTDKPAAHIDVEFLGLVDEILNGSWAPGEYIVGI